jgi:hypothetical protein
MKAVVTWSNEREVLTVKKLAALAVIPLFAGFLYAQQDTRTETQTTTTKTTTFNGTLVDAGCRTSTTDRKEMNSSPEQTTTSTEHSESTDCPVTTNTTSFGLLTSDGRFVRFDNPSNSRIVEMMKTNKTWTSDANNRTPIKVQVVGTPNGEVVVMQSIR